MSKSIIGVTILPKFYFLPLSKVRGTGRVFKTSLNMLGYSSHRTDFVKGISIHETHDLITAENIIQ